MVDDDPVLLLGHPSVARAETGLDVGERQVERRGRERAGERRDRVAVDDDRVGTQLDQDRLEPLDHGRQCGRPAQPADPQRSVGRGQPELLEEAAGHLVVVVLAGVDQDRPVAALQRRPGGGRLDQLRARPHDAGQPHAVSPA